MSKVNIKSCDIPVPPILHLRDLLSHNICFSEVDEMSETGVVGTGRYKTLINQVMIKIAFFRDVRIHMDANSVMRTFSGKVFTYNALLDVHNNDSIREHRVMKSLGKDSTQRVSQHSECRLVLTV